MTAAGSMQTDDAALAAELREAIEKHRLRLYYQPIVSLVDRVASEVEALPRWPREDREILAPPDFIGVAVEFGLLADLERWVIEATFEQLSRWRRVTDIDMSLNLSENHLYETQLTDEIRAAAGSRDVAPGRLNLEISETAVIEAAGERLARLEDLRQIGVGLTINDYSGVLPADRLGDLPIGALKISRQVVAGIPDSPRSNETASTAIGRAQELGLKVVANGIESPGQLAALREMGCKYGQGFLFSVPMPAEVLAERALPR
jgi:EAL domain-containing protein (putative c-di-GMP-specific phosphodiesterase class I)